MSDSHNPGHIYNYQVLIRVEVTVSVTVYAVYAFYAWGIYVP